MENSNLLIDNWSLDSISKLLSEGITQETAHLLFPNNEGGETLIQEIPYLFIQIESLFNLLVDIVTREKLIVDEVMAHSWMGKSLPINNLHSKEIIIAKKFNKSGQYYFVQNEILNNLNLPSSIISAYTEHVEKWKQDKIGTDQYLSTVLGGALGYLSRSAHSNITYSPHPTRKMFLKNTAFHQNINSTSDTFEWVNDQRQKFIKNYSANGEFNLCKLALNPIIIEIIESSSSIPNMFTTALQIRDHYRKFRSYMSSYQNSIEEGDLKALRTHKAMLEDVENVVFDKYGKTEYTIGFGLIKVKGKTNIILNAKSQFGIRAVLKKMIFTKFSNKSLEKFTLMLGEDNLTIRKAIFDYFSENKWNSSEQA